MLLLVVVKRIRKNKQRVCVTTALFEKGASSSNWIRKITQWTFVELRKQELC